MKWLDIGVTVLLTLRLVLLRTPLPQLMDPNNDAWLLEGKMNSIRACSSRKSLPVEFSQLHIYVMPIQRHVNDFAVSSQYNLSQRGAS
jgi:hypothetical protein